MADISPPSTVKEFGDLGSRERTEAHIRNRRRVALIWSDLEDHLEKRGWGSNPGSIVELYAYPITPRRVSRLWLSPTGDRIRIRLDADSPRARKEILKRLASISATLSPIGEFREVVVKRADGETPVIESETALPQFFANQNSVGSLRARVRAVVEAVLDLADADAEPTTLPLPDLDLISGAEGAEKLVMHLRRERSARLRKDKIAAVLASEGVVQCEACGFDFGQVYGDLGREFGEVHHTQPISKGGERRTKLHELAILCSNCHRMIHKTKPMWTVSKLRKLVAGEA